MFCDEPIKAAAVVQDCFPPDEKELAKFALELAAYKKELAESKDNTGKDFIREASAALEEVPSIPGTKGDS